jgi:hypothetical protein
MARAICSEAAVALRPGPPLLLPPLILDALALILAHAGVQSLIHGPALLRRPPELLHEGLAGERIQRAAHLARQPVDLVARPSLRLAFLRTADGPRALRLRRRDACRRDDQHRGDGRRHGASHRAGSCLQHDELGARRRPAPAATGPSPNGNHSDPHGGGW